MWQRVSNTPGRSNLHPLLPAIGESDSPSNPILIPTQKKKLLQRSMGSVPTPPLHHHGFADSFSPKSPCIVDLLDFFDISDVGSFEKRILKWKEKFDAYLLHVIEEQIPSLVLSSPQEQEVIERLRDILTVTISASLDEIKEKSATFVSDLLALQHQLSSDHKMLFTRIILEFSNFSRLVQSMGISHPEHSHSTGSLDIFSSEEDPKLDTSIDNSTPPTVFSLSESFEGNRGLLLGSHRSKVEAPTLCRICEKVIPAEDALQHISKCELPYKKLSECNLSLEILRTKIQGRMEENAKEADAAEGNKVLDILAQTIIKVTALQGKSEQLKEDTEQMLREFRAKYSHRQSLMELIEEVDSLVREKFELLFFEFSTTKPSIDDFNIIKIINQGAYGKVFLVQKKATSDLYSMKVIKKRDAVLKQQKLHIMNERNIFARTSNPYVVKLFYTFQDKKYLYYVMEFINGGDLESLLTNLSVLDEEMARTYTAEIALSIDYLHSLGIIHRDIKPDNILINHQGHVKLTDFGLSQFRFFKYHNQFNSFNTAPSSSFSSPFSRSHPHISSPFVDSSRPSHIDISTSSSSSSSSSSAAISASSPQAHSFSQPTLPMIMAFSPSTSSPPSHSAFEETTPLASKPTPSASAFLQVPSSGNERPMTLSPIVMAPSVIPKGASTPVANSPGQSLGSCESDGESVRIIGTPFYIAPEVILGQAHGPEVDWWALGVMLYEFLTSARPFNGETSEEVFENIINGDIVYPQVPEEMSEEAYDLISRLLEYDPNKRLGHNGIDEIKQHPFFASICWEKLLKQPGAFVPKLTSDTDTSYFVNNYLVHNEENAFYSSDEEEDEINHNGSMSFLNFSFKSIPNLQDLTLEKSSTPLSSPR